MKLTITVVLFMIGGIAGAHWYAAREAEQYAVLTPLTEDEFEQIRNRPSPPECRCIDCKCNPCKCLKQDDCVCDKCEVVKSPEPSRHLSYAAAYAEAVAKQCRLLVIHGAVSETSPDAPVQCYLIEGSDPDFKLPSGVYVYEFKSDGKRPAGLYGGLYSGTPSRPGQVKATGPVWSCGPGGCRRIR